MRHKEIQLSSIGFLFSVVLILHFTLLHRNLNSVYEINWIPFEAYIVGIKNLSVGMMMQILGNYVLFIPFGLFLKMNYRFLGYKQIVLYGFLFSLGIESIQGIFHLGYFETDDILGNTLGTFLGYCLFILIKQKKEKRL